MMTGRITVASTEPPVGKGPGKVIGTDGAKWKVWPDKFAVSEFVPGHTYDIGYKPGTYTNPKDGKSYPDNTIQARQDVTGSQVAAAPTPAPVSNGNGHSDNRDRNIFICGVVNQGIAAGKIDPFSAIDLTNVRKAATAAFEACP